jgi:transcriptional regulator with XRE-family HTH domain
MHRAVRGGRLNAMITSSQMKAARALLGIDQRQLAEMAGLSLPTIQRMEASGGQVRGIIDTLMKVVDALESAGVELIGENAQSAGKGRGVRLREGAPRANARSYRGDHAG